MIENRRNLFEESSVYDYLRITCKGKGAKAPSYQDAVMQSLAFAEGVIGYHLNGIEQSRRCRGVAAECMAKLGLRRQAKPLGLEALGHIETAVACDMLSDRQLCIASGVLINIYMRTRFKDLSNLETLEEEGDVVVGALVEAKNSERDRLPVVIVGPANSIRGLRWFQVLSEGGKRAVCHLQLGQWFQECTTAVHHARSQQRTENSIQNSGTCCTGSE